MGKREIEPIAVLRSAYHGLFGIPRQSGRVDGTLSTVVFEPPYRDSTYIRDIEGFEYLWLIFDFSEAHRTAYSPTVRPPRLGGNKRVGVFASRSPFRPNSLGLSSVKLIEIKRTPDNGTVLVVGGADLLDGTPIYDIKPYLPFSDAHPNARAGYAEQGVSHRLSVLFQCDTSCLCENTKNTLLRILSEDPRPSYQDNPERIYKMEYDGFSVAFTVKENALTVTEIKENIQ